MMRERINLCVLKAFKEFLLRYRNLYIIAILFLCAFLLYGCEASVKVKWPRSEAFQDRMVISQEGCS